MLPTIQARLLELNRRFYATVGGEFDRTRQHLPTGMVDLAGRLAARAAETGQTPLNVIDVGCGNGRFARALAGDRAQRHLSGGRCRRPATVGCPRTDCRPAPSSNSVSASGHCRAELGVRTCRTRTIRCGYLPGRHPPLSRSGATPAPHVRPCAAAAPDGVIALSTWQFLSSERLANKQVEWTEAGVDPAELEDGDALLPWNQGAHALRYVHQLDLAEVEALAQGAGLRLIRHLPRRWEGR